MNRAADVAVAGFGLLVTAPVLGVAAAAVKLADGGPVLYRQQRSGPGDARITAVDACAASRSTSCPSSGTSSAAT